MDKHLYIERIELLEIESAKMKSKIDSMYPKVIISWLSVTFLILSLALGSIPSNYSGKDKTDNLKNSSNSTVNTLDRVELK
jgi:hypothetical protein